MFKMTSYSSYLARDFQPRRFEGSLLLFEATQKPAEFITPATWESYVTGRVDVRKIPCRHVEMMTDPLAVDQIGQLLEQYLKSEDR